ncbi:MAG: type II methionyl aminopeptidase [Candidatus Bathyarchaeota archaeon]|jgi:methionyl aminopeptidase
MAGLDEEALEKYRFSGRILRETRQVMKDFVKEDMLVIEICEKAEGFIREKGGSPAFPCNVSINEVAAHYTSPPEDKRRIPKGSIVKLDMGVQVDGYVTDTAVTISFRDEYDNLVDTVEQALGQVIETIHPGMKTSEIGSMVERSIKARGFKPISNLTGHDVGRYIIHAGTSIPNVSTVSFSKLQLGKVYAIEPFVTLSEAIGRVINGDEVTIFRLRKHKSMKNPYSKQLLKEIKSSFRTLPFAERWVHNRIPKEHYREAFRNLLTSKVLMGYPTFVEASGKPVAQAEHSVLMVKDGCEVLT